MFNGVDAFTCADLGEHLPKVSGFLKLQRTGAVFCGVAPRVLLVADEGAVLRFVLCLEVLKRQNKVKDTRQLAARLRALDLNVPVLPL